MRSLMFLYVFWIATSLASASSGITFHGRIVDAVSDAPFESATAEFRIRIKSPGAEDCTLWEEVQTKNMSNSDGVFTLMVGDTTATVTSITNSVTAAPFTLPQVFANGPNYTGLACGNYSSQSLHGRVLEVSFRETAGIGTWEDIPPTRMNYVPLAYQSVESEKLGGRSSHEFLKIASYPSQTILSNPQVDTLLALVNGTATSYLRPSDSLSGDVTGPSTATVVSRIRGTNVVATAPTLNQVLKFDGTNWVPSADDAGASGDASYAAKGVVQINTDLATSGLNIAGGILSMPNVGTAGSYGSATQVPVITTDIKGRVTAVTNTTVDDTTKLPLAGGTMTGPINMGTQNITNATSVAATNFSGRNLVLNDNDTNTVTLRTPNDITANYALTLPVDDGTVGQILTTDGAGVLSWGTASGGTVTSVSSTNNYLSVATATSTPALTLNVGTAVDTVAAGNDSRITGALQSTAYNADLAPAALCTTAQTPYWNTVSDLWACQNIDFAGSGSFVNLGNSFTANATLGTNDNFALNFETNGSTRMTILNSGYVGVGTTNPVHAFHVVGDIASSGAIVSTGSGVNSVLLVNNQIDTLGLKVGAGDSINLNIDQNNDGVGALNIRKGATNPASATPLVTVLNSGNVGIGATAPGAMLQVGTAGTSLGTMRLTGNTSGYVQIQPAAAAGSWTMTLPANDGDPSQVLTTDGSGVTSWTTASGGATTIDGLTDASTNYATTYNVYLGSGVGATTTTGTSNTGLGAQTLQAITDGYNNSAFGHQALQSVTTGYSNTAIGRETLTYLTTGEQNTVVGMYSAAALTTGGNNTIIGNGALTTATTASGNAVLGSESLTQTTGGSNVALGTRAGAKATGSSYSNIFIGHMAGPSANTADVQETLWIHNYEGTPTIYGDLLNRRVGIGTTTLADKFHVLGDIRVGTAGANGCLKDFSGGTITGTCSSDIRLKKDFRPMTPVSDKLSQIQPMYYKWRSDEYPKRRYGDAEQLGVIAQEVKRVFPSLVIEDEDGYYQVKYADFTMYLLKGFAEHHQLIKDQSVRSEMSEKQLQSVQRSITSLEEENSKLKTQVQELQSQLKSLSQDIELIKTNLKLSVPSK